MNSLRLKALAFLAVSLVAGNAMAATIQWTGAVSGDVSDANNWSPNMVPAAGDLVEIGNGAPNNPDLLGSSPTWGGVNLFGSTTISDTVGGGTLDLLNLANGGSGLFSGGSENSTIDVPLNVSKIQTNGDHSVTFNAAVVGDKLEAFGTAVATYNAPVTVSQQFTTIGGSAELVINDVFNWTFAGEKGLNNSGGTLAFGPASTLNWNTSSGGGILNLFGNPHTVRADGNNVIGQVPDVWSRNGSNILDLNGFSQALEFLGTNGGANLDIDFGAIPGANDLVWDASFNSNGTYTVLNFEPGIDKLEFGPFGPGFPFASITINGVAYAENNPGDGSTVWTTIPKPGSPGRQLATFVPEPGSAACVCLLLVSGALRRTRKGC